MDVARRMMVLAIASLSLNLLMGFGGMVSFGHAAYIGVGAYAKEIKRLAPDVEVRSLACPLFVSLAEEGWTDNDVAALVAEKYLAPLRGTGIDVLVLGCTHYPLLKKAIRKFMGSGVRLVDSAAETAHEVQALLRKQTVAKKSGKAVHSFFVTDAPDRFIKVGRRFLGEKVESAVRLEPSAVFFTF